MKRKLMTGSLPSDMVAEILSRLPVKSVLRFRSVCKTWFNVVDDSQFVSLHLIRTAIPDLAPSLLFIPDDHQALYFVEPEYQHYPNSLSFKATKLNFPAGLTKDGSCQICSADGLLCTTFINSDHIYTRICNPATGIFVELPVLTHPKSEDKYALFYSSAFCFDRCTEHYKVVHTIKVLGSAHKKTRKDEGRHFVFSFARKGSQVIIPALNSWRLLSNTPNGYFVKYFASVAALNNSLHWLIRDDDSILTFNLGSETFGSIATPHGSDFAKKLGEKRLQIMNIDGCLSIADAYFEYSYYTHAIGLWIMKDYNVNQSWTKIVICPTSTSGNDYFRPISFWKNDMLLLLHDQRELVSYDIDSNKRTSLSIDGIPSVDFNPKAHYKVHRYMGNLLQLQDHTIFEQ